MEYLRIADTLAPSLDDLFQHFLAQNDSVDYAAEEAASKDSPLNNLELVVEKADDQVSAVKVASYQVFTSQN